MMQAPHTTHLDLLPRPAPQTTRLEALELLEPFETVEPKPTVILIDDSPIVRAVVETVLRRAGLEITAFNDGLTFLGAMVRGEVSTPNLVLIDIGLPKMDGYEIAQILRNKDELKDTQLVMLSAHNGPLNKVRARMLGVDGFIAKPFRSAYLRDFVLARLNLQPVM